MSLLSIISALIIATVDLRIFVSPAAAQTSPAPSTKQPTPVRTILASAALPTVIDVPLHYKLIRVSIPAERTAIAGQTDSFFKCLERYP